MDFVKHGREDYAWFMTHALDVKEEYLWYKMQEVADSMRDNERTTVGAGHGVSKTYSLARLCLGFLICNCPSTVVTTAPTDKQVTDVLWREIRAAHTNARIPMPGKLTTKRLDLQEETGRIWFATGFSTKPDSVTKEATAFQGYHNDALLIVFDEAAGIMPEIWRASEHIGAPFKRFVAIGNPTAGVGEFAESLSDPSFNHINIAVTDTPNYKENRLVIPGVYGREYEERIRTKYGIDSDTYRVRVMGLKSQRSCKGSYYSSQLNKLRKLDRIGHITHNPNYEVYIIIDPGYTTAFWFVQNIGTNIHFIDYYEDSGIDLRDYADLFWSWSTRNKVIESIAKRSLSKGYQYADMIVPCDTASNGTKIITGQTTLDTYRGLGFSCKVLEKERSVIEGIVRTQKFLDVCYFSDDCKIGLGRVAGYHEKINKGLSTDENPIFTGSPEKDDGNAHGADALRYVSLAAQSGLLRSRANPGMTAQQSKDAWAKYRRT